MNYYTMTYSLSASISQSEMMQLLKSNGSEVIQTSDGLFVKTSQSLENLNELLASKNAEGVQLSSVDAKSALQSEDTPQDVKAFIGVSS